MSTSDWAPAGTPAMMRLGEMFCPSHVKRAGIEAPVAKSELVRRRELAANEGNAMRRNATKGRRMILTRIAGREKRGCLERQLAPHS